MENAAPFFCPSSYIIDQNPDKYGGRQEDYQRLANESINLALGKVEECEKTENKLTQLFFEILEEFGKFRHDIAQTHKTFHAERFGLRRDINWFNDFYFTSLDASYKGYNTIFLDRIASLLQGKPLESSAHKKITISLDSVFKDCQSSFELEVIDKGDPKINEWNSPLGKISEDFPVHLIEKREDNQKLDPNEKDILRKGFEKLKKEKPEVYKKARMRTLFFRLNKEFPSPQPIMAGRKLVRLIGNEDYLKSFYALGTARFLVNGKMYTSSQYIIWLYRDFQKHPLRRMKECTTTMMIHQDNFLIPETLNEIAKRFAQSVMHQGENLKELKDRVGLFRFYFAANMPWARGSASAGDMFETMLYRFHGHQVTYNPKKMVDLEVLTTPLVEEFMAKYDSMIYLKPLLL